MNVEDESACAPCTKTSARPDWTEHGAVATVRLTGIRKNRDGQFTGAANGVPFSGSAKRGFEALTPKIRRGGARVSVAGVDLL